VDYAESDAAVPALWELAKTYIRAKTKGFEEQLTDDLNRILISISDRHAPGQRNARDELYRVCLKLMVGDYMRNGEYNNAIETCNKIIKEFPNSLNEEEALYDLFSIYLDLLEDEKSAEDVYWQLAQRYPKSSFIVHAQIALGIEPNRQSMLSLVESEILQSLPEAFLLESNYPNPFNPETAINYAVPKESYVLIEVYNVLGKKVTTLVDESKIAGYYTTHWDGRDISGKKATAGIYLCRMRAGDFVKTQKMMLLP